MACTIRGSIARMRLFEITIGTLVVVASAGVAGGCGSDDEAVFTGSDASTTVASPDGSAGLDGSTNDPDGSSGGDADTGTPLPEKSSVLAASGRSSCAILENGSMKCWGRNHAAAFGLGDANLGDVPSELGAALPALDLGTGRTVVAMAPGDIHVCALLDTGAVKCWGSGNAGQLGYDGSFTGQFGDALPAVKLGAARFALEIGVGYAHSCAILDDHSLKCWGLASSGQLGLGDTSDRGDQVGELGDALPKVDLGTGRTARQLRVGRLHTCALLDDGTVKCWGRNQEGQLGVGDAINHGDSPGTMGDALPAVDLGTGRTAKQIDAGDDHTCALLDDDSVKCWGYGGRLGVGDPNHRGSVAGGMGDALPAVALGAGRTARRISAGGYHTCAILDDGSVKCWGHNEEGQLGLGDTDARGDGPNEMGDALPAVDLGPGRTALEISAAMLHTCARLDDGTIKCWGRNAEGQLGLGDVNARGDGPGEMGAALAAVKLE